MAPYEPQPLPISDIDRARLITLVGEANAALARYDGLLHGMVNPAILLSPMTNQEAVLSSKIEGTQATIEEVLEHEAGRQYDENKTNDIQEVLNYRTALRLAQEYLAERPIRLGLVLQLHKVLMDSVRGQNKTPGEFRKDQNWIGAPGCKIEEATFVPPNPIQLPDHLEVWEAYINGTDFDVLAQAAVMHAQFELIHPFKDGNGRIGRLLIPLFLFAKGRLLAPMFYLSAYLEANRDEYYSRLQRISREQNWTGWIEFFLRAIIAQARTNTQRAKDIMALYDEMKVRVREATRSQHAAQLTDALFTRPIFGVQHIAGATIPKPTAHLLIRQLVDAGIIMVLRPGAGRRAAIYAFPRLLDMADGGGHSSPPEAESQAALF
jgi:Fic family protein